MSENINHHGEIYWKFIEPIWEEVDIFSSPKIFLEQFAKISLPQQNLLAVHWCCSEVENGGLHQFFWNPTGILAPEAVKGFQAICFDKIAKNLQEAMRFFGEEYPREQRIRIEMLDKIRGTAREDFDPFSMFEPELFADNIKYEKLENIRYRFEIAADNYAKKFLN